MRNAMLTPSDRRRDSTPDTRGALLVDSTMWQSPEWTEAVDTVFRLEPDGRKSNGRLRLAMRLFRSRARYDVVLTTGNQVTLYYGLLCRLFFVRSKQVVVQLYLNQRPGLLNWLHDVLMRMVLARARGVLISSTGEAELVESRFGVPQSAIRFIPYHTNVMQPEDLGTDGEYVLAAGRNFRDYDTLIDAVDGLDVQLLIVCGQEHLRGRRIPSNVTVEREIPWDDYLRRVREARFVVVPLSSELVPAGQVAILEAMGYGKPVITTRSVGTTDYVRHEIDGLLYTMGDARDLRLQIERLTSDDRLRERLGQAAHEAIVTGFTFAHHVQHKLQAMRELGGLQSTSLDGSRGSLTGLSRTDR